MRTFTRMLVPVLAVALFSGVAVRGEQTYVTESPVLAAIGYADDSIVSTGAVPGVAVVGKAAGYVVGAVAAGFLAKAGADLYDHFHDWMTWDHHPGGYLPDAIGDSLFDF